MTLVAGIDGGGTRTRCLIADAAGGVLGAAEAGPANCARLPLPEVADTVSAALTAACRSAGCSPGDLHAVCAGLAGFYPPWHAAELERRLSESLHGEALPADEAATLRTGTADRRFHRHGSRITDHASFFVVLDLEIAWAGGLAVRPGVVLVGGTGSVAYGRDAAGRSARAGGWGYLAGDEGSAYWIGREALGALALAIDGRGPATALTALFPAAEPSGTPRDSSAVIRDGAGLDRSRSPDHGSRTDTPEGEKHGAEEWLRNVYRERWSPAEVAALTPLVIRAAAAGDEVARLLLERAGEHLGRLAEHVFCVLELESAGAPLVMVGGVLEGAGPVRDAAAAWLRRSTPGARLQPARLPAVAGALLLALQSLGIEPGEDVVERLSGADKVTR